MNARWEKFSGYTSERLRIAPDTLSKRDTTLIFDALRFQWLVQLALLGHLKINFSNLSSDPSFSTELISKTNIRSTKTQWPNGTITISSVELRKTIQGSATEAQDYSRTINKIITKGIRDLSHQQNMLPNQPLIAITELTAIMAATIFLSNQPDVLGLPSTRWASIVAIALYAALRNALFIYNTQQEGQGEGRPFSIFESVHPERHLLVYLLSPNLVKIDTRVTKN
ncbi:MAG: hypothetical protein COY81_02935 [Candidatus Pacebacteria bacterium CG_4_10_14_0_8_um_filter_43_12]|nr:MAG: hypothetical protein COU66_00250 [Candidatus Pacebacteria bacterium CG10_big_fil_rev_8_21_14_0_10_44_11]PIY79344.1 MAG: hypothetical protein COY81_02935 [Candidatus Pacebacteria bacterium CG_4_10_14_0_8_um_filter_43_12]